MTDHLYSILWSIISGLLVLNYKYNFTGEFISKDKPAEIEQRNSNEETNSPIASSYEKSQKGMNIIIKQSATPLTNIDKHEDSVEFPIFIITTCTSSKSSAQKE